MTKITAPDQISRITSAVDHLATITEPERPHTRLRAHETY